jgi:hypothetical protein
MLNYVNCDIVLYSGYMSLEYATLGQFSTKADMYNFSIILLESINDKKAILQSATNNMYFVEWVKTFDHLVFHRLKFIFF